MSTYLKPPTTILPVKEHTRKVVEQLINLLPETQRHGTHALFLQACPNSSRDDTDRELPFHQEANFNYLTGSLTPSSSLFVTFTIPDHYDAEATHGVSEIKHTLLIPAADPLETLWSVAPPTLEEARRECESDEVEYTAALSAILETFLAAAGHAGPHGDMPTIHTLPITTQYPPLPTALIRILPPAPSDSAPLTSHRLRSRSNSNISLTSATGLMSMTKPPPSVMHSTTYLLSALHRARLVKTEAEIERVRYANEITSGAHEVVMRELGRFAEEGMGVERKERTGREAVREWKIESEGDAEAVFVAACRRAGADQAYLPIVASGTRASTLHYVCNDRLFPQTIQQRQPGDTSFQPRELTRGCCGHDDSNGEGENLSISRYEPQVLLIDAGCEWKGYASDVTRTIPVGNGGKFTSEAGEVYDLVLRMQKECEAMVKPGVHWDTLHLHAHKVLIAGFLDMGIFVGDKEDILRSGISAAFLPHGLGHSIGLDVHDSLQYLRSTPLEIPETSAAPSGIYKYLRIRQPLQLNMLLTVEPGCYFAPQMLEEHGVWQSKFVDAEVLKRYVGVGGVRIEDVVVVRRDGAENLTRVGRERACIEAVCSGSDAA